MKCQQYVSWFLEYVSRSGEKVLACDQDSLEEWSCEVPQEENWNHS